MTMKHVKPICVLLIAFIGVVICVVQAAEGNRASGEESSHDYTIQPAPFADVRFAEGSFWEKRQETNRLVTVPHDFEQAEETGRIRNFAKAGALMEGRYEGLRFNDSDVYKIVEGAAYVLAQQPDPELDQYLDDLIAKFAAAQIEDGYLYTVMTVPHDPEKPVRGVGYDRWVHGRESHELYCVGHMYEAASAHFEATGKRSLLDIALKSADLVAREFGPDARRMPPGHQEIELGLVRLYRITGERKYLELARFFLEERGRSNDGRELWGSYFQDHAPVTEQDEAMGHAVRAGYMYAAMADVAALTGDQAYRDALDRLWENVAEKKLYLTGGVGGGSGEGFSAEYILPNLRAYNETCSSIANVMWNHRMFLLNGDAKYIDILERTIYNSFLSGIGMSGDVFFYPNRLASHTGAERSPWFPCACCPPNVARFIPRIGEFQYGIGENTVFVNLYSAGVAKLELAGESVKFAQDTNYPWNGRVRIGVDPEKPARFTVKLRIPGWVRAPFPSTLYTYLDEQPVNVAVKVNGRAVQADPVSGYVSLKRKWKAGDMITLDLPMSVRTVIADARVESTRGRVALMRGPIVYCAEGPDNGDAVHNLLVPENAKFGTEMREDLLGGVMTIKGRVKALAYTDGTGGITSRAHDLVAIPYYAWAHRGKAPMRVWLAREQAAAWPEAIDTLASRSGATASHKPGWATFSALNDQILPFDSNDQEVPRFSWYSHRGTTEWVQYKFPEAAQVSSVKVYWAADTDGPFRVPKAWRLLYRDGGEWKEVSNREAYGVKSGTMNHVDFEAVETDVLRIEATLQPKQSGGILEWRVN